jgi:hypothetical protein
MPRWASDPSSQSGSIGELTTGVDTAFYIIDLEFGAGYQDAGAG